MSALQCVLEAAPAYFRIVSGAPPGPAEAQGLFTALPQGKGCDDKLVWGLYSGAATMVAVLQKPLIRIAAHV